MAFFSHLRLWRFLVLLLSGHDCGGGDGGTCCPSQGGPAGSAYGTEELTSSLTKRCVAEFVEEKTQDGEKSEEADFTWSAMIFMTGLDKPTDETCNAPSRQSRSGGACKRIVSNTLSRTPGTAGARVRSSDADS